MSSLIRILHIIASLMRLEPSVEDTATGCGVDCEYRSSHAFVSKVYVQLEPDIHGHRSLKPSTLGPNPISPQYAPDDVAPGLYFPRRGTVQCSMPQKLHLHSPSCISEM